MTNPPDGWQITRTSGSAGSRHLTCWLTAPSGRRWETRITNDGNHKYTWSAVTGSYNRTAAWFYSNLSHPTFHAAETDLHNEISKEEARLVRKDKAIQRSA